MDGHTTTTCQPWILREHIGGIATVEHNITSLRYDLRGVAYHILLAIDAGIDSHLSDDRCTTDHTSHRAHTFDIHFTTTDNHLTYTAALKCSGPVNITDDNLRSRDDNAIAVMIEQAVTKAVIQSFLDLLNLRFLLLDFSQILIDTLLKLVQQVFPIVKYITHDVCLF